ncbi:MAG TPA: hypothetical protein VFY85_14115 [Gemmatimonadaceae bacterium]|nr:hypothetical protein [Gemmatimonadaceae bacterium]
MSVGTLVDRERERLRRAELAAGVLLALGVVALGVGLGAILLGGARWLSLPRGVPVALWLLLTAALVLVARRTRGRLASEATRVRVARAIEEEQGLRRGQLVGAIELDGRSALASRAAGMARGGLPASGPLAPAMQRASSRRTAVAAGVAGAGMLLLASTTPVFGDGLRAVMRPIDAWRGALLERLRIDDAPAELLRGSPLHVRIHAPGRRHVVLFVRQTGEAVREDTLAVDPRTGSARWSLDALRGDVSLRATDGRATSDSVIVHAADRPFVGAVVLRASYPPYLGRPAETLPVGEPLRLPKGTLLAISGRASVPLASVQLTGSGVTYDLVANGHRFDGRLVATRSLRLEWAARGSGGVLPDLPPALELEVLADSAPHVEITSPTGDTLLVAGDSAALGIGATDDHGIAAVRLRITRGVQAREQAVPGASGSAWAGAAPLDLAAIGLASGEAMRVRAEAVDASPWAQVGASREIIVRRATRDEIRASARALGDSAVQAARAAVSAQQQLAQRTDEAARAQARSSDASGRQESPSSAQSAQKQGMSYESAEKARALAQQQRAMTQRVEQLRDATKQLEEQLRAAGALDSALQRQLAEAQALLRQALTPELMAQMQKLESASQQQDGQQARDALRDLARMQQQLREQLERSAEMLERAAAEGAMQTLSDQARELAAKERAFADSGAKGQAQPEKAASAENLAQQSQQLREAMADLKERLEKNRAEAGASRAAKAAEHAASSDSAMRRAASAMRSANDESQQAKAGNQQSQSGSQQAQDAASEMQRAAQAMQDARDAQVKEWKQELTSALDQGVQEMLQLARQERGLEQQARGGSKSEDRRGAQSAVEQGVNQASQKLEQAGRKSALVSPRAQRAVQDAKQKVSEATRSVAQPQTSGAQQGESLGAAADALTRAAAALARDRERANAASSASGFGEMLQQLQQAAQKQGQINSQAQSLFSMPGGSPSAQSLARALARQQRGVADQLEDAGDAAGGDKAAQLAQEARRLADALDGGRLDAGTLARQQQLFRRLLDAGRSLEKEDREDTGKREATSARGDATFTPAGTVQTKAAVRFPPPRWEELRGLPADERRAILDYFTRLNSAPTP